MTVLHRKGLKALAPGAIALTLLLGGIACSAKADHHEAMDKKESMSGDEVLARVNGKDITAAQVSESVSADLERAEAQLNAARAEYERNKFSIMESGVKQVIEDRLLEAEAAKRGVTKEELVATEIEAAAPAVTDADVDAWYNENQARLRGRAKEEVAPQIQQFLEQQRLTEARTSFMKGLRDGAEVAILLDPPRADVEAVGPSKGPADAPVTIVEFSDFECPFCSRVNPTLDQVRETYGDKVRIVFRQFPLRIHANAPKAAEASLCADDQGKFWEMHDLMFEEQQQLTVPQLKAKAARLELDTATFDECLDSGKYQSQVQADLAAGTEAGVSGTPAMFINGRLVSGAVPFADVAEVIDMELAREGSSK
jgi:protein-disulfide isomerase